MKMPQVRELIQKYESCLQCGNSYIGNGAGTLVVTDTTFERSCPCGWSVVIEEADK